MESERATSYGGGRGGGERGAGGKFMKPPPRKPPSTPYDRPVVNQSAQGRHGGWLSKLVDPAYRLISGSATKLMPSLFSKSPSTSNILPSDTSDHGNHETEVIPNAKLDDYHALDSGISRSDREAGPSKVVDILKNDPVCDDLKRDNMKNSCDDSELCKIEHLVKGKMFSREVSVPERAKDYHQTENSFSSKFLKKVRHTHTDHYRNVIVWTNYLFKLEHLKLFEFPRRDEINRLTEILNSKVVSDVEREKERPSLAAEGGTKIRDLLAPEYPTMPAEGKKDVNRTVLGISSPRIESNMQDEVIASPVDIARAYMGRRTSELGPGSYSIISKSERPLYKGDDIQSNPFIPPPSPKSSTCWPGAMVQDQRGYTTPLSQRGTFRPHNFQRTPYSRTVYSKSKAKLTQLQAESRCLNISSNPFQQSRTPIFGQVKSRADVDNRYGSVGAIRRIQNKFATETPHRGSASLYSLQKSPSHVKESNASKVFFPVKEKNMELGGTSGTSNDHSVDGVAHGSEEVVPTPNLPSSPAVRGILEHLANKPTPHDLAAELKIAIAWKKSPSKDTDVMQNESTSLNRFRGSFDSYKSTDGLRFSAEGTDNRENLKSIERSQERDVINAISSKASNTVNDASGIMLDANAGPSFGFNNISDSQCKSTDQNAFLGAKDQQKDTSQFWPLHKQVNGQDVMTRATKAAGSELLKKQPCHFSGTKPTLKSIFVNKPDPKRIISSDNGPGFTFPVSAPGVLSEPPTPSIMPTFSSGGQPKEVSPVPSYTFGTKGSHPRLDFSSFPSTSNASTHDDALDLKFNFGSDKKARVSFKSIGKDAFCY